MEDLNAASIDDVKDFFRIYYAPNNAVLVLAGDLDPKETLAKVKKYFGEIPRQAAPPPVDITEPAMKKNVAPTWTIRWPASPGAGCVQRTRRQHAGLVRPANPGQRAFHGQKLTLLPASGP